MRNPPTLAQDLYRLGMKQHRSTPMFPIKLWPSFSRRPSESGISLVLKNFKSTPKNCNGGNRKIPSSQFPLDVKSWNEDISVNPMRNRQNGWVPMEGIMAVLTFLIKRGVHKRAPHSQNFPDTRVWPSIALERPLLMKRC